MDKTKILYSPEQIRVPPELGDIIKVYSKAVFRSRVKTQHLIQWSANYFARLSKSGEPYQVNEFGEYIRKKSAALPKFTEKDIQPDPTSSVQLAESSPAPAEMDVDFVSLARAYVPGYRESRPLVIVGSSCVGKSTVIQELMRQFPGEFAFPVYHTTRPATPSEQDGVDFHFVKDDELTKMDEAGELVEVTETAAEPGTAGVQFALSVGAIQAVLDNPRKSCVIEMADHEAAAYLGKLMNCLFVYVPPPATLGKRVAATLQTDDASAVDEVVTQAMEDLRAGVKDRYNFTVPNEDGRVADAAKSIGDVFRSEVKPTLPPPITLTPRARPD